MKYTHIGLQDQADALAGLPNPNAYTTADWLGIGWVSGGAQRQEVAAAVSEADPDAGLRNEQTPDCSGVVSSSVASCHQMATCIEVEAAGIAPASRDPSVPASTCVSVHLVVGLEAPSGRVLFGLSRHEFNPSLNRRFGSNDPALTSPGVASGRRHAAKPLGLRLGSHTERVVTLGN
jgi:hypothetical protein